MASTKDKVVKIAPQFRIERCDGHGLREALIAASAWLEVRVEDLNRLNVFPVPDGDTGTNLHLTMRSVLKEMEWAPADSAGAVAQAAARGALMGARGNSGVILSQLLRGLAEVLGSSASFDTGDLARAFDRGVSLAYACVTRPAEGTILTVSKDVARAARGAARDNADLTGMLESVVDAAQRSVQQTPSLLPILREAGVVDAGGLGLMLILEGAYRFATKGKTQIDVRAFESIRTPTLREDASYPYCAELVLRGERLSTEAIRQHLANMGDSLLLVSDGELARVHIHTRRPGAVLEYLAGLGTLHQIKIDNMQDQHEHLHFQDGAPGTTPLNAPSAARPAQRNHNGVGVVAISGGGGFTDLFRSLNAVVVPGGSTMNPAAEELLRAVNSNGYSGVILLPNHPNAVLNAQQVSAMASKPVAVVTTRSMPEGLAAMLAFDTQSDIQRNAAAMERASASVQTAEVTLAVRSAHISGFEIREGQPLGFVEGNLVAVGDDENSVVLATLGAMHINEAELISVYYGSAIQREMAEGLVAEIRERYPRPEVQLIAGGQLLYDYIVSLE